MIRFIMYKISFQKRVHEFILSAMSENHAEIVANDFYNSNGLIGRYYCELPNGKTFSINS